jgi:prolyl-tRNA editing enzyme YbaK/EbsC (Cys-tRNA(Pro) deacylase)
VEASTWPPQGLAAWEVAAVSLVTEHLEQRGPGFVLVVLPAARRLDLRLVREAVGDNHARLATEEELGRHDPVA